MTEAKTAEFYREKAGRVAIPNQAFIDGKYRPAASGAVFENVNPATGEAFGTVAACDAADVDLAVTAARRAFEAGSWSRAAPETRKAGPPPPRRPGPCQHRGAGGSREPRQRQDDQGLPARDRQRGADLLPVVRRADRQDLRQGRADRREHRRSHRQGAHRRRRPGPAVELPAADGRLEAGAGARRGLLGGAEARRADAAHRAPARGTRDRSGLARRRPQRRARLWRDRRPGDRPPHGCRRGVVHRLDRGRRAISSNIRARAISSRSDSKWAARARSSSSTTRRSTTTSSTSPSPRRSGTAARTARPICARSSIARSATTSSTRCWRG